jgi:hypothetical protein
VAAIVRCDVSVIAFLVTADEHNPISALCFAIASFIADRLQATSRRASVSRSNVAIVAGLSEFRDAIAANCLPAPLLPAVEGALPLRFDATSEVTAIARLPVTVVALFLTAIDHDAVSTEFTTTLSRFNTQPSRLDLAVVAATVTAHCVSVVASLSRVEYTIAADDHAWRHVRKC